MKGRRMNNIPFCFGEKHRDYMRRCLGASVCVAEGAVRSGKTVDHVFVFAKLLEDAPDRLHLATGPTLANARLNIGSCNGFGLEALFRGRCRWGKDVYKRQRRGLRCCPDAAGSCREGRRGSRGKPNGH